MSLRPAFGAGIGYSFGRLWGKEDQELSSWMWRGAALGATSKLIQRSGKVFAQVKKICWIKLYSTKLQNYLFKK